VVGRSKKEVFENLLDDWTSTYTCKLDTTVTTLGSSTLLLDVKVTELATGSLDDSDLVGLGVVAGSGSCQRVCFIPEVVW
jgi:hypothetical protein